MRIFLAVSALSVLAACQTLPMDMAKMSPEQIKEAVRDKSILAGCTSGKTAAGNLTTVHVSADQVKQLSGTVTIDTDCRTVISSVGIAASAVAK